MRVGFIGCVESSLMALNTLVELNEIDVVAVVTRESSAVNSDFVNLRDVCIDNDIPYFYENPKERHLTYNFLKKYDLDVIYCFGWSYLLGDDILNLPKRGVIGFHPAKLPQNRGRHPIIWALALGLDETASTFFKMTKAADAGPILSQELIAISTDDDSRSLYSKVLAVAKKQIIDFTVKLSLGKEEFVEQDIALATNWRKRSRKDGLIDWRMSAESIYNLIRALAPPYPGAEFYWEDNPIIVASSSIDLVTYPKNIEPGRVLDKKGNDLLIKCSGENAIWLHNLDSKNLPEVGEYL